MGEVINQYRRNLLQMAGLLSLWPKVLFPNQSKAFLISGFYTGKGKTIDNYLRWLDLKSGEYKTLRLDFRGHGIQAHPNKINQVLVFPRRPGTRLLCVDLQTAEIVRQITADTGYHFYGHGVYEKHGHFLYTTENQYNTGEGVITVRDAETLEPIKKFSSGGIGPHDIKLLSDNKTLVVANGGIKTNPAKPRQKLNINNMESSLVYLDRCDGTVLERYQLDDAKLSIRHLAVTSKDEVVAVQQYQGLAVNASELVMFHKMGNKPRIPGIDDRTLKRMNAYTASVVADDSGNSVLVTSPKGNIVTLWDIQKNRLIASYDLHKPYGVVFSPDHQGFVISTVGTGLYVLSKTGGQPVSIDVDTDGAWDNHMLYKG